MFSILHVITSPSWGGLEMYVVSLIREQAARGLRVGAFVLSGSRVEKELADSAIALHKAQSHSHFNLNDITSLRRTLLDGRFAIVHSHTSRDVWPASLAALGTSCAHVNSVYVVAMPKRDPHHWFIYRRVDALVSSSQYVNARLGRELPISKHRIHLVRYARPLDRFTRSESVRIRVREQLGIADGQLAFGMIGRIEASKGVHEFAKSLLSIPEDARAKVKYIVVGARPDEREEPYFRWLTDFQQRPEMRDHLEILEWTPDAVPYLNALDALVLASHREMYSLSVLEALAMSIPVIGTDAEGTTEQIGKNERGILVEPRSSEAIAAAVLRYVAEPDLLRQHGEAGFAWVHREHELGQSLRALENVYAAALERRKAKAFALPKIILRPFMRRRYSQSQQPNHAGTSFEP